MESLDLNRVITTLQAFQWDFILRYGGTFLIAVGIVTFLTRYIQRTYNACALPQDFIAFTQTGFPAPVVQQTVCYSEVERDFRAAHNGQDFVFEPNKRFLGVGDVFSNTVKHAVIQSVRPQLEVDSCSQAINIDLTGIGQENDFMYSEGPYKGLNLRYPHLDLITFTNNEGSRFGGPTIIKGAVISRVVIQESFVGMIWFSDCWIGSFKIEDRKATIGVHLSFSETYIGHLEMCSNGCMEFDMTAGGVKQLTCPPAHHESPITKSFSVDRSVILHRAPSAVGNEEIVNYRDLLFHIRNRTNPFVLQIICAAVFRLEMRTDTGFLKVANICYRNFSDYNTRPGRPIIWMTCSLFLCFYLTFTFDFAIIAKECATALNANLHWMSRLCETDGWARASRSLVLILSILLNPFSAFSETAFIKAQTIAFNLFLLLGGLLNLIWITLAIFSVKTRFSGKASSSNSS